MNPAYCTYYIGRGLIVVRFSCPRRLCVHALCPALFQVPPGLVVRRLYGESIGRASLGASVVGAQLSAVSQSITPKKSKHGPMIGSLGIR